MTALDASLPPLPALSLLRLRFSAARLALDTIGRLSRGIAIGHAHGFDSGVMLDHIYVNRAAGRLGIGVLIDRLFLAAPGWAGIRNRGELLQRVIVEEVTGLARSTPRPVMADLACGGARYGLGALAALDRAGIAVDATLRDYRPANVELARRNAAAFGVAARIELADAFSREDLARLAPPDLVVVSGLHEIIADDDRVRTHFRAIADCLPRGGRLVVTVQPDHPQHEFIARVLTSHTGNAWAMRLRPVALTTAWASEAGFVLQALTMEPKGIFGVAVFEKA